MLKKIDNLEEIVTFAQSNKIPRGDFSILDIMAIEEDIRKLKPGDVVVEIGVRFGMSLTAIAMMAVDGVKIYGIDIEDPLGRKEYWKRVGLDKVATFIEGESVEVAKTFDKKVDLIHIDGNHFYEPCKADIEAWYPKMAKDGVMLFHDCDESSIGVMRAVTEFVDIQKINLKTFTLFKETHKNTSIARIML